MIDKEIIYGKIAKMRPKFDERDAEILKSNAEQFRLNEKNLPLIGEWIRFKCGTLRRVSHVWNFEPTTVQTSDGGSWYLGNGYCSFSGSLYVGIPIETLKLTDERMNGKVWFFHHNYAQANSGVDAEMLFRVWGV